VPLKRGGVDMSKIEKPVMIDTRDKNGHEMSKVIGWNKAIDESDKYWEQETKKRELLRVELEMKLKYMEQEVVRKDGIIEICWEHINGLQKFIELDNS